VIAPGKLSSVEMWDRATLAPCCLERHQQAQCYSKDPPVLDAHLVRIDAVNPALSAVVRALADDARTSVAISPSKSAHSAHRVNRCCQTQAGLDGLGRFKAQVFAQPAAG
jgi:hypothetical protein